MKQLTDNTWQSDNGLITFIQGDCNLFMAGCKENEFDLSCVDPPYGIGDKFKGGKTGSVNFNQISDKGWDKVPTNEYFNELFRISKNQIIWGGNYFNLGPTRCFLIWDKCISDDMSLAMCEMAWTSFDQLAKIKKLYKPKGESIHPTEKPISLYRWIFKNYAKPTDHIFDSHGGSMSSAIAAHMEGLRMTIVELDDEYFAKSIKRFATYEAQQTIKFD